MRPAGYAAEWDKWGVIANGGTLAINPDVSTFPGEEYAVDVENDGEEFACLSLSDGSYVGVFFSLTPDLISLLRRIKIVGQNFKSDLHKLNDWWGVGIHPDQVVFDTRLASYVMDSSSMSHGLKDQADRILGIAYPEYEEVVKVETFTEKTKKSVLVGGKRRKLAEPLVERISHLAKVPLRDIDLQIAANYNGMDSLVTARLKAHYDKAMSDKQKAYLHEVEMPVMRALYDMEKNGIRVDIPRLESVDAEIVLEMDKAMDAWKAHAGEVNPRSPLKVKELLLSRGFPVKGTDEKKDLAPFKRVPLVASLLAIRELLKLRGTYTLPILELARKSKDGRIRSTFNQSTITGRLSSSDPINFQNLPSRGAWGKRIRECFVADEGCVFGLSDYSQIDLRVLAHLSGEPIWVEAFQTGGDVHQSTADKASALSGGAISRSAAKTINFAKTYGSRAENVAYELGGDMKSALALVDALDKSLTGFSSWRSKALVDCYMEQGIHTLLGRFIPIPHIRDTKGFFSKRTLQMVFPQREAAERECVSYQGQGGAAEITKLAMIRLHRLGVKMLLQEHDAIGFECRKEEAERVQELVTREMEGAMALSVPLKVDCKIASSWGGAKG